MDLWPYEVIQTAVCRALRMQLQTKEPCAEHYFVAPSVGGIGDGPLVVGAPLSLDGVAVDLQPQQDGDL